MGVANKCFITVHKNTVDATGKSFFLNLLSPFLVKRCRLFKLYVTSVQSCFVQTIYKLIEDCLMGGCCARRRIKAVCEFITYVRSTSDRGLYISYILYIVVPLLRMNGWESFRHVLDLLLGEHIDC